jgi:hypothetical protein
LLFCQEVVAVATAYDSVRRGSSLVAGVIFDVTTFFYALFSQFEKSSHLLGEICAVFLIDRKRSTSNRSGAISPLIGGLSASLAKMLKQSVEPDASKNSRGDFCIKILSL